MDDIVEAGFQAAKATLETHGISVERVSRCTFRAYLQIEGRSEARLVKFRSGSGEHFSLRKRDLTSGYDALAYVWNADLDAEVFILTLDEALDFLGPKATATFSWMKQGYYKWSSASGLPKDRTEEFRRRFSQLSLK